MNVLEGLRQVYNEAPKKDHGISFNKFVQTIYRGRIAVLKGSGKPKQPLSEWLFDSMDNVWWYE